MFLADATVPSLLEFISLCTKNVPLLITSLLVIGVIFVNGWTDAPNAIATVISTRSMGPRKSIIMAAIFNFLGVLFMTFWNASVAMTMYNLVDFGKDTETALVALCAAFVAIVVWAVGAWYFGIPTSESHALIAGVTGAAVAINGFKGAINNDEWLKVIKGLFLSTVLGFFVGFIFVKIIIFFFKGTNRRKSNRFFKGGQIAGGAAMAFMHGAQDGQKFLGIFMLGLMLAQGVPVTASTEFDLSGALWLIIMCSLIMGLGTSIGGYRIIKSVGMDMVKLEKHEGFSADFAAAFCLLLSHFYGLPVSTTHTKTTAIMGVGAAKRLTNVNWSVAKEMFAAWFLTFPGCGLIGYVMAQIFLKLFA